MRAAELQLRAIEPEPFVILGLRLLPLTLGHVEMMRRFDVADIRNPGDLATACIICSMPHDMVVPWFNSRLLPLRLWCWRFSLGAWNWQEKLDLFSQYIRHHTQLPDIYPVRTTTGDASPSPTPFDQTLRVFLLARLNYSPDAVGHTPFLRALWDYYAWLEMEGRVYIEDTDDEDRDPVDDSELRASIEKAFNQGEQN